MKRVCGLDVHKDSVFVCIMDESGVVFRETFGVLTCDLKNMAKILAEHHVMEVAMESTSIYWIPIWRILEPHFSLKLVNPYFIKQLPGRKSDVKDAEWIATCLLKDLIRGSFVPKELIQRLRQYDRRIFELSAEIAKKLTKIDACMQRCNVRLSNYVSNTDTKSYKDVVNQITSGNTDPENLITYIHGRILNKWGKDIVKKALTGVFTETDIDILKGYREEVEMAVKHKEEYQSKMNEICREHFPEEMDQLQTVPGINERSVTSVIAEVGNDMSVFKTAAHLVSWCGLRPRNEESAGKIKGRKITHGNKFIRKTLVECAWAASRTKDCFYSHFSYTQTVIRRKTKMKVIVAIARKLLVAIWFIIKNKEPYKDCLNIQPDK